jgi:hypothetical protein
MGRFKMWKLLPLIDLEIRNSLITTIIQELLRLQSVLLAVRIIVVLQRLSPFNL